MDDKTIRAAVVRSQEAYKRRYRHEAALAASELRSMLHDAIDRGDSGTAHWLASECSMADWREGVLVHG